MLVKVQSRKGSLSNKDDVGCVPAGLTPDLEV